MKEQMQDQVYARRIKVQDLQAKCKAAEAELETRVDAVQDLGEEKETMRGLIVSLNLRSHEWELKTYEKLLDMFV